MKIHLSSPAKINEAIRSLASVEPNGAFEFNLKKIALKRTSKQNRTIHKWFNHIADSFNNVGQELNINGMAISPFWTKELIKELVFKPVMIQIVSKEHTSDCTIDELSEAINVTASGLNSIGHDVAVPSKEQLRNGK
ncbi:MAG: hypothetical protein OQK29_01360 [Ignavibacteriaceae bacterium]|nr:hypothetical protein [Ignavibacteriaceae bacterium]